MNVRTALHKYINLIIKSGLILDVMLRHLSYVWARA